MTSSVGVLVVMAALGAAVLAAVLVYRWRQRVQVRRVASWIKAHLHGRYGQVPDALSIHCSDDDRWPILVSFRGPRSQVRHNMQFSCAGTQASLAVLSEKDT